MAASRLTATRRLAALVAVVGLCSTLVGSADGAAGSSTGGAGVSSLSWSHTVASATNRMLVVGVEAEYATSSACQASSVTYGGTALTKIDQAVAGTSLYQCVSLWYLVAPPVGTATVSVSFGATLDGATAGAASLSGIKQAAPDASNTSFSNSGATSTSVTTTAANSTVIDVFGSGQVLGDLAPGTGQTAQWSQDAGGSASNAGGSSTKTVASAGSTTMTWTQTGINRSAQVVAAFAPADATPPNAFAISSPSAGATVSNGQTISSSPTDNVSVASVSYRYCPGSSCTYAAGTDIGTATSGPPFTVTWSSQPANGTYTLIARATDPSGNSTDSSGTTVTVSNGAASWYGSSWGSRKLITIDHTKVAAAQTSFPVLISFASDADLAAHAQSSGNDILFTAADGTTKLNHEIESYTSATGALVAWVNVPSLSSTVDTKIYMYFGNPSASNQQNVSGTWSGSNYNGVWHLPNGSSLSLADSTPNGANGTNSGATATAGKIDGAASLSGSGQYATVPSSVLPASDNFTVSVWFKTSSNGALFGEQNAAIGSTPSSWDPMLYVDTNGRLEGGIYTGATPGITSAGAVNNGSWHYAVLSVNKTGTTQTLYLDGSQVGTWSGTPEGPFSTVAIGASYMNYWPNAPTTGTSYFNGQLDEVRVSNSATAHSSSWIATEWNNESSPSSFISVGSLERYDTTPPNAFAISSPSAGATVSNGQTISSSPTDNVSVASVSYRYCPGSSCTYAAGTDIGTATSGPPFTVTWSSQPANGTYTLIARATDPSGNSTDSSGTTVTVQNQVSIALVQKGTDTRSSGTSVTPTLGAPSTAGTLLVAYVQWYSTTSSVSAPSGWVQATSAKTSSTGTVSLWYYPNNPGGITSVTLTTTSSGGYFVGELSEWSGVSSVSPLDRTGSTTSTSTTSVTVSTSGATTAASELAITGFTTYTAPGAFGPGSGWSNVFSAPSDWATSDYKLGIASGSTVSETETDGGTSNTWAGVIATFRPVSACSGGSLGLSVPSSVTFPSLTLNGSDQTVSATVALAPDDETGGGGWNITGTSTTLTGASRTLPTTATAITAATATAATGNCSLPTNSIGYPVTLPAGTSPPTPVKLYNAAAGTGSGPVNVSLTARVAVPANAYSTTYTATWTLAIVSGP